MSQTLRLALEEEARRRGFAGFGVASPEPSEHLPFYREWLAQGHHGEMGYLARDDALARRGNLGLTMADVRSAVVVAQEYFQEDPPGVPQDASRGVVARYARGQDYHDVLKSRLQDLLVWLRTEARTRGMAEEVRGFAYVDTGPILERELAHRAGLGWFGKNTMLIHPRRGSYFFLGLLLVDLDLPPTLPLTAEHCGSCRACLEACPTGALLGRNRDGAPVMDARRCISYLTIELKGPIPRELRPLVGNRIFGCDICQEVCPFTAKFGTERGAAAEYKALAWPADREGDPSLPSLAGPDLVEFTERILAMSGKEYQRVFGASPLARPGRKGMLRNLCVALGNYGASSPEAARRVRPVLERAGCDPSEVVREHAEWGLEKVGRVLA